MALKISHVVFLGKFNDLSWHYFAPWEKVLLSGISDGALMIIFRGSGHVRLS